MIMAMRARPLPIDPYNPSSSPLTGHSGDEHEHVVRHPSPFIPIRIPVFALVIWINDAIVRMLNALGGRPVAHGHRRGGSLEYKKGRYSRDSGDEESAEDGKKVM
jgi:etoposide-induced 2.4 mRNA